MATYNAAAVADAVIAHKKGITLQTGRALRDNPLATFEGATGAPYIEYFWHPFDGAAVGDGNDGEIWSFAADGAVNIVTTPAFEAGFEYRVQFDAISFSFGTRTLGFQVEKNAVWSSAVSTGDAEMGTSALASGTIDILRASTVAHVHLVQSLIADSTNAVAYAKASAVFGGTFAASRARFSPMSGGAFTANSNFDAGAIRLLRRKIYA